jgi:hypothetical protein
MEAGRPHLVAGGVELTLHPAVHAETCYGFLLAHYGQALLGFTVSAASGIVPQAPQLQARVAHPPALTCPAGGLWLLAGAL